MRTQDFFRLESPRPDATVVVLTGEHDVATTPVLERLLGSLLRENRLVVLDLSEVEFVDSSVINSMLEAKRTTPEQTSFVVQVGTEAVVHRVLDITGVLTLVDWAPTREGALAKLDSGGSGEQSRR